MADLVEAARERFPRVAISHEWLTVPGGSEQVVEAMLDVFPQAELFTSVHDPAAFGPPISGRPVHASFLNRVPNATRIYPRLLPLMDAAFRSFDLSGFDLVLSSNHACAKNVRTPQGARHVCYCHTPMRYAWDPAFLEGEDLGRAGRLARARAAAVAAPARPRGGGRAGPLPGQLERGQGAHPPLLRARLAGPAPAGRRRAAARHPAHATAATTCS